MPDYGRPLEVGISPVAEAASIAQVSGAVLGSDWRGLDLAGIQDRPSRSATSTC